MKSSSAPRFLRVSLLAACLPIAAFAQPQTPPKPADTPVPNVGAPTLEATPLMSFKFPGGTMAQFSAFLREMTGDKAFINLLIEPSAANLHVVPFELRNTSASALVTGLNELIRNEGAVIELSKTTASGEAVLALVTAHQKHPAAKPYVVTQPFRVAHLIKPYGRYEIGDVVSAIQTAWELEPRNAPGKLVLKYHEPTHLLFASGDPEGVTKLVPGIVSALASTQEVLKTATK